MSRIEKNFEDLCDVVYDIIVNPPEDADRRLAMVARVLDIKESIYPPPKSDPKDYPRFEEFWAAYPKKKSKGQALKTWHKIHPGDDLVDEILRGLSKAKNSQDWLKDDGKYIPHASTWLNAMGWTDETEEEKPLMKGRVLL